MASFFRIGKSSNPVSLPQLLRWYGVLRWYGGATDALPVVVVGAGPTGLTLSHLLSRYGISNVVLEKNQELSTHPQAHYINNRTMEVFRGMSGLSDEVKLLSPPLEEWRRFSYCEAMTGQVLGEVDHFPGRSSPHLPEVSPEPVAHVPQSLLLPLLFKRAMPIGSSTGHVIWGCRVKRIEQDTEGVEVWAEDGSGAERQLRCSYLAAADGAHSQIRQALGVSLQGEPAMQHLINIHFFSKDLASRLRQRPAMLYFVFNAAVVGVVVAHRLKDGEFVAQVPYFPPLQSPEDFSASMCRRLVTAMAGLPYLDMRVATIRPWAMSAQVADRFSVGRAFLLGDAAHRFPPAGGFGMNSGVQDAHNLAWKLAAVVSGEAAPQLLDSYHQERRPVALANTALSVSNWREAVRVPSLMGLDPGAAALLNKAATAVPGPAGARKALLEAGLALGRWASQPLARLQRSQLRKIFDSGETLRLQFPREDLGFEYGVGALCKEQQQEAAGAARGGDPAARGAPYVPSTRPGCRLPHVEVHVLSHGTAWMLDAAVAGGSAASTLDLVVSRLPHLVVFVPWEPGALLPGSWLAAAAALARARWPLLVVCVLTHGSSPEAAEQLSSELARISATATSQGADAWMVAEGDRGDAGAAEDGEQSLQLAVVGDLAGRWQAVTGLGTGSTALVRPDGHVAWRALGPPGLAGDGLRVLSAVVRQIMGGPAAAAPAAA